MNDGTIFSLVQDKDKLSHPVLNSIKEAVVQGCLKPGDKLPGLVDMAEGMGVRISLIREVIRMLEMLKVLESKQGKGAYMYSGLSPGAINLLPLQLILILQSTEHLVQSREMYESAFTMLAMKSAMEGGLAKMEKIVVELERRTKTQGADSEDEMVSHSYTPQCARNPYVICIGEATLEVFLPAMPTCGGMAGDFNIVRDHRKIYGSIKNHDVDSLNQVLKKSLNGWGIRLSSQDFYES